MSQADELLNSLSEEGYSSTRLVNPSIEPHIVINKNRYISVPEELWRIGVQNDHNIESVTFDCPRYWDGHDMSLMKVYINYMRKDGIKGSYWAEEVTVDGDDESIMHFCWVISRNVTEVKGDLKFLVCIKKIDEESEEGDEINHWNSELNEEMYVSEGLECQESILDEYPDIITQLLTRMDKVEEIATIEAMQGYVNTYFASDLAKNVIKDYVYDYMLETPPTTPEFMLQYVRWYYDKNPPLFVIGPNKPQVKCLWFNTGDQSGTDVNDNIIYKMTSENDEGLFADIDGVGMTKEYEFDII